MKGLSATLAAVLVAGTTLLSGAPVQAQGVTIDFGRERAFVQDRCDRHPNWRGCDDFRRNRGDWDRDDYRRWYGWNRNSIGALGFGLFAFALGAAAASAADNDDYDDFDGDWEAHVDRCYAAYRSYDEDTDMFLSYHNGYQRCRL